MPGLKRLTPLQEGSRPARPSSATVRPHLEERTQSSFQRAAPPRAPRSPVTFSAWPCRPCSQHEQASSQTQLGLRPVSGLGHLSAPLPPAAKPRTPVPPAPAPWRPKPRGAGGGGENAARRRVAPARRALRAGLGTHRARGARGPGPPSAPLTLKTRSLPAALAPPPGEVLASLSWGFLTPPQKASMRGPASRHLAGKVPRETAPKSMGLFQPRSLRPSGTRSTGLFIAAGGKSPWEGSERGRPH